MRKRIENRIDKLRTAFAWSLENDRILTTAERICISQERASWLRVLNRLYLDKVAKPPRYIVSPHINAKIDQIIVIVKDTNWTKPEEPFY